MYSPIGLRRSSTQKQENEFSAIIADFYDGIGHNMNKNINKQSVLRCLVNVLGGKSVFLGKNRQKNPIRGGLDKNFGDRYP